jgi:poly(beta-D-mannuronate) lyase
MLTKCKKIKILLLFILVFKISIFAANITVSSQSQLTSALSNVAPGDIIILSDGTYSGFTVTKSGTATSPIIIKAANLGKAIVSSGIIRYSKVSYVTIQGLRITTKGAGQTVDGESYNLAVWFEATNYCRLSGCTLKLSGQASDTHWVLLGGKGNSNRIDHCEFGPNGVSGHMIWPRGQRSIPGVSTPSDRTSWANGNGPVNPNLPLNTLIDHNYLHDQSSTEMIVNGGLGTTGDYQTYGTIIEYNIFENGNGDPEVISIKSSGNTVRYNTLRNCKAMICCRAGNKNTVQGNFIFGAGVSGCGGIRIYEKDHVVSDNYVEVDGYPLIVGGGDSYTGSFTHAQVFRAKVVHNTLIGKTLPVVINYNHAAHPLPPVDMVFANNIIQVTQANCVDIEAPASNPSYSQNIVNPLGSGAGVSGTGWLIQDPKLTRVGTIMKLSATSPAINAANQSYFPFVTDDVEGQPRDSQRDIGADEYSTAPILRSPLTTVDVGPGSLSTDVLVPAAPSNLAASVVSCSQVNLTWTDNATNETSYKVENVTSGASVSLPVDSKSYSFTGLSESTAYSFRVTAVNSIGSSTGNPTVSATTIICPVPTVPNTPSGLAASVMSCSQINLTWTDNANNETGYIVTNSTTGAVVNLPADSKSCAVTGLAVSTTYNFTVSAVNSIGSSINNPTVSATTLASCTPVFEKIWLEAENGTISSPMAISSDALASNGKYIMAPSGTNSSSSVPSSGYSTMSLNATGGSYALWFRTILPTTASNSFYYRIDAGTWVSWNVDANVSTTWTWRSVATITLSAGSHTLTVAYREGGSKLDRVLLTNDAAYVPTGMGEGNITPEFDNLALEAESGTITSPMAVQSDALASGGQYIMAPSGTNSSSAAPSSGYSTINFTAAGGSYKMWFKTILPTTATNSFYYRIDGGSWVSWNIDANVSTTWTWRSVASFTLTAGAHTLTIAYREGGSQLDRIAISNDPAYDPATALKSASDEVSVASSDLQLIISPNPVTDANVQMSYSLIKAAKVKLVLYNGAGQVVKVAVDGEQEAGQHNVTVNVSDLLNGTYIAVLVADESKASVNLIVNK